MDPTEINQDIVEDWADECDYNQEDLEIFAGSIQVGQLLMQTFADDARIQDKELIDNLYEAMVYAAELEDESLPNQFDKYVPTLSFKPHVDELGED